MANESNLSIKLNKSLIGRNQKHISTAHSLGLFKIGDTTVQPDNEQTKGKVFQIGYLVSVCEAK